MLPARIYVGGVMVGLLDVTDGEEAKIYAQRIANTYPDSVTILRVGRGSQIVIKPKKGVVKETYGPVRKPRTQQIQRRPR